MSQSVSVVAESSKPTMESTETSAMPEATTISSSLISSSDQDLKLLAPIPSSVLGHPAAEKALAACSNSVVVVLGSVKVGFSLGLVSDAEVTHGRGYRDFGSTGVMVGSLIMVKIEALSLTMVSPILGQYPWVVHNPFSPLSDLTDGVIDEFVEGEDHVEVQKSHHHVDTMSLKYRRATTMFIILSHDFVFFQC